MRRRGGLIGLVLASVLSIMPAHADPLGDLVAAASKEGSLRLMWGEGSLGGSNGARLIVEAMNNKFGTGIKFQFTPAGSMAQFANQLLAEARAGRPASTDVWLASTTQAARGAKDQSFAVADWPALLPGRITPGMVEGGAVRLVSYMAGISYNTILLPDPPRSMAGFLGTALKGKLATTPDASGFDIMAGDEFWGLDKTLSYAARLSRQVGGLLRCNEMERIAAGEFAALILDCGGGEAVAMAEQGAPMAQIIPSDFRTERFFYLGVPRNGPHQSAGKLFIAFMMTPEGQELAWRTWHLDLSMFPASRSARILADSERDGVKFHQLGVDWWLRTPENDDTKSKLIKIFRAPAD
jgi:ABC-type Fe3+ transport system substrate-binding protein